MRISDWSSDVCSSDLGGSVRLADLVVDLLEVVDHGVNDRGLGGVVDLVGVVAVVISHTLLVATRDGDGVRVVCDLSRDGRSEEHTSELQSLMRSSYAGFCLKKKTRLNTSNVTMTRSQTISGSVEQ